MWQSPPRSPAFGKKGRASFEHHIVDAASVDGIRRWQHRQQTKRQQASGGRQPPVVHGNESHDEGAAAMRHMLLAIGLIVGGCAKHSASVVDGDPFNPSAAAETVYVWNGRECVEESLTPDERRKRKMFQLKSFVMKDGQMHETMLWVERVEPEVVNKMLAQGGSIQLPNGERLEIPVQRTIAVVENGRVPLGNGESIGVEGVPDGTQLTLKKQYVTTSGVLVADVDLLDLDDAMSSKRSSLNGVVVGDVDLADPALSPPDKSEWWKSPAAVDAVAKDGIKVPPVTSAQGRVGTVSMSYGMGQTRKP
jgi:hypothetical protein